MKSVSQIKAKLKRAKNLLILAHSEPDGDAIGSAIMLEAIAKKVNPKIKVIKKISELYRDSVAFYVKKYKFFTGQIKPEYDLVIAVDTSTQERLPVKIAVDINIDHHADNEKFAELNIIEKAAAVGIILFDLAKSLKVKFDQSMAEGLYLSIYTDTGNFSFANTDQRCFELAALCLQQKIDPHAVYKNTNEQKNLESIRAFGQALNTIEIACAGKLIIAAIENERFLDNRTLIDYIRQEKESEVAVVLVKRDDHVKVSLRAKTAIDVAKVAKHFAGGGHFFAAAGKIPVRELAEAKRILIEYFEKNVF